MDTSIKTGKPEHCVKPPNAVGHAACLSFVHVHLYVSVVFFPLDVVVFCALIFSFFSCFVDMFRGDEGEILCLVVCVLVFGHRS